MLRGALSAALVLMAAGAATAQEWREAEGTPLPPYAQSLKLSEGAGRVAPVDNGLPNIVMTGFWPPTNEMLRQFSTNVEQNPGGWAGENWENRGYNVYAFFPEFPAGLGKGEGDFEVDYQDTSADFWALIPPLAPIAIISHGRSGNDHDWELEGGNRMYSLSLWSNDYLSPYDPTPELPIANEAPGTERMSSLPIEAIIDAVSREVPALYAYSPTIDTSRFLCNFMGYHINWYRDMHNDPSDPAWCATTGYIHLGYAMTLTDAVAASEVTLREVIERVNRDRFPGDLDGDQDSDAADFALYVACVGGPGGVASGAPYEHRRVADLDGDGDVDLADYGQFAPLVSGS
jgi:hypothetical protein